MPLTPILKTPKHTPGSGKRVIFTPQSSTPRIKSIIKKFRDTGDTVVYSELFKSLRNESLKEQQLWLTQMTNCVPILDRKVDKLVMDFLKIPWFWNEEVSKYAENFLVTLATAHNYYTYEILHQLVSFLVPDVVGKEENLKVNPGALNKDEKLFYRRVLKCIHSIYSHVPMSSDNILILAKKCMPYFKQHVHKLAVYSHNLLLLTGMLPHLRQGILEVILSTMVTIDVHAPRTELAELDDDEEEDSDEEEVFDMEIDGCDNKPADTTKSLTHTKMDHEFGNALDVLMTLMLQYVHDVCHGYTDVRSAADAAGDVAESTPSPDDAPENPDSPDDAPETPDSPSDSLGSGEMGVKRAIRFGEARRCRPGVLSGNARLGAEGGVAGAIGGAEGPGGPAGGPAVAVGGCECSGTLHNIDSLKTLFLDLKTVFSHIVLTTHASSHTQFLLFYLLALRPGLSTIFLEFLRIKKFENPNCGRDVRRNAMMFIGSLLARGKFVPFAHVHSCLEIICLWCHNYLDKQEETRARNYEDLLLHAPFYCACQTIFYVFTFRYRDYSETTKKLELARGLNLERLVLSQLNPLRVCAAPVVNNFAAVTRRFQLAYCYTIMENNKRLGIPSVRQDDHNVKTTMDAFFPFDPYLLLRSKRYIINHYREFDGLPDDEEKDEHGVSTRAFDENVEAMAMSPQSFDFSYSTSPGYQKWPMALEITKQGLML